MSWIVVILAVIAFSAAATFTGWFGGADLGEVAGTVRWSERKVEPKTGLAFTSFQARLHAGKEVMVTSPYDVPPKPGEQVVLHVRRNILGWHSYSWVVGKEPALTDGAGAR